MRRRAFGWRTGKADFAVFAESQGVSLAVQIGADPSTHPTGPLGFVRLGADAPTSDVRVGGGWYGKNTSSIQLLSSPRERSLALLDKNQKPQVALSLKEDDGPAISLRDAVGRERAVLGRTDLEVFGQER